MQVLFLLHNVLDYFQHNNNFDITLFHKKVKYWLVSFKPEKSFHTDEPYLVSDSSEAV